ncbi:hypothetical protein OH76DRAFT_1234977 [Lentinus brumalis]|uniref:Uncharacterized protein n=1 Tax=Lentinus brumalis TaxID=2498619 RepID=A0A371CSJ5_9APHY|nr:hypothetical protein OH76DRAFT_1234977 [Polyporus brumalis]
MFLVSVCPGSDFTFFATTSLPVRYVRQYLQHAGERHHPLIHRLQWSHLLPPGGHTSPAQVTQFLQQSDRSDSGGRAAAGARLQCIVVVSYPNADEVHRSCVSQRSHLVSSGRDQNRVLSPLITTALRLKHAPIELSRHTCIRDPAMFHMNGQAVYGAKTATLGCKPESLGTGEVKGDVRSRR